MLGNELFSKTVHLDSGAAEGCTFRPMDAGVDGSDESQSALEESSSAPAPTTSVSPSAKALVIEKLIFSPWPPNKDSMALSNVHSTSKGTKLRGILYAGT